MADSYGRQLPDALQRTKDGIADTRLPQGQAGEPRRARQKGGRPFLPTVFTAARPQSPGSAGKAPVDLDLAAGGLRSAAFRGKSYLSQRAPCVWGSYRCSRAFLKVECSRMITD